MKTQETQRNIDRKQHYHRILAHCMAAALLKSAHDRRGEYPTPITLETFRNMAERLESAFFREE